MFCCNWLKLNDQSFICLSWATIWAWIFFLGLDDNDRWKLINLPCKQLIQKAHQLLCSALIGKSCKSTNVSKKDWDVLMDLYINFVKHSISWVVACNVSFHFNGNMAWEDREKQAFLYFFGKLNKNKYNCLKKISSKAQNLIISKLFLSFSDFYAEKRFFSSQLIIAILNT